jgi:hypothetical protein
MRDDNVIIKTLGLKKYYKGESIKALDDVNLELIAERFEDALEHNDRYWDHYWGTMGYVINEYIKENKLYGNDTGK